MTVDDATRVFSALCAEAAGFLGERAAAFPDKAALIHEVRAEIEAARLPDPLPKPCRLAGVRHFDAAMKLAADGPMEACI